MASKALPSFTLLIFCDKTIPGRRCKGPEVLPPPNSSKEVLDPPMLFHHLPCAPSPRQKAEGLLCRRTPHLSALKVMDLDVNKNQDSV